MSTGNGENISLRVRQELERLDLSGRKAAQLIGEKDDSRIKQVLNNRQRLSAEMLSSLVTVCGVNGQYVLTGEVATGVDIDAVREVMQMVEDAEALVGEPLSNAQRVQVVCGLLKASQTTGRVPGADAVVTAMQTLI